MEVIVRRVARVVELVEMVPIHIGESSSQGLTNCADSGKAEVVEAETCRDAGEFS